MARPKGSRTVLVRITYDTIGELAGGITGDTARQYAQRGQFNPRDLDSALTWVNAGSLPASSMKVWPSQKLLIKTCMRKPGQSLSSRRRTELIQAANERNRRTGASCRWKTSWLICWRKNAVSNRPKNLSRTVLICGIAQQTTVFADSVCARATHTRRKR